MRAALIKAFGEPTEVIELADVPGPSAPAAGEVLVSVCRGRRKRDRWSAGRSG
jgi:NADPH:quinone reductase-like Zn-dependent oxidoreductase